MGLKLSL